MGTGTALPEPWMSALIIVMSFIGRMNRSRSRIEQGHLSIELEWGDTKGWWGTGGVLAMGYRKGK